jgi:hypothetical protein
MLAGGKAFDMKAIGQVQQSRGREGGLAPLFGNRDEKICAATPRRPKRRRAAALQIKTTFPELPQPTARQPSLFPAFFRVQRYLMTA